ncbi:hypothetical protein Tco_1003763 [Tanacetum coccineum]|uniref:Uncharacterized protein n=1 Tax=Tanacetum coccineum TaxID=301880 RepID=A0ABQ5FAB5_9ASTR
MPTTPPSPQQTQQDPTQQQFTYNYPIWEVISKMENGPVSVSTDMQDKSRSLPLKTAEEIVAREEKGSSKGHLVMAIPDDHLCQIS